MRNNLIKCGQVGNLNINSSTSRFSNVIVVVKLPNAEIFFPFIYVPNYEHTANRLLKVIWPGIWINLERF